MTASLHSPDAPLALVTGAARGIGAQVALQLAEQGYDVLVAARDLDQARSVMDTNLFGTWRLTQALLPALRRAASSARIVMVGSGSGSHGDPDFGLPTSPVSVSYAVSKAALHALTVKLSVELAPDGILVNAVDPGLTATAPGMEAMGARPVADGARSVVHAALLPDGGPTGTLTRDGEPMPW